MSARQTGENEMTREDIKARIVRNLADAGLDTSDVRAQPDPFAGWHVVVVSREFAEMSGEERRLIALDGLEEVRFEGLDLLTPEELEWAGPLPIDSDLEDIPDRKSVV